MVRHFLKWIHIIYNLWISLFSYAEDKNPKIREENSNVHKKKGWNILFTLNKCFENFFILSYYL